MVEDPEHVRGRELLVSAADVAMSRASELLEVSAGCNTYGPCVGILEWGP